MKKILFVSDSLELHGAAKSLVNLLSALNIKDYSIDLFLFHTFDNHLKLPDGIQLLPVDKGLEAYFMPVHQSLMTLVKEKKFTLLFYRFYNYVFTLNMSKTIRLQHSWPKMLKHVARIEGNYDLAISYLDYFTSEFILKLVQAAKYVTWNHNPVSDIGLDLNVYKECITQLHQVITVSERAKKSLQKEFGTVLDGKIIVFSNPQNSTEIIERAIQPLEDDYATYKGTKILTIGRLSRPKNHIFAVSVAKLLKQIGFKFHWYFIGDGEKRGEIAGLIKANGLVDFIVLMGMKDNPYPYIAQCDIYAQPSLYEAECIALKEARTLKKPVIATLMPAIEMSNPDRIGILELKEEQWVNEITQMIEIPDFLGRHILPAIDFSAEDEKSRCNALIHSLLEVDVAN